MNDEMMFEHESRSASRIISPIRNYSQLLLLLLQLFQLLNFLEHPRKLLLDRIILTNNISFMSQFLLCFPFHEFVSWKNVQYNNVKYIDGAQSFQVF